ncbi:hypothetical protein [Amycolatopsis benzoatilytica]|uniref:hypothetical protein n=1 Tax=Amycolatopsis benzoatilytica TaxID=346045 RepID=UPI001FDFC283|nr:hypothetical protein [Amycolatopsis benzoatilytica]
MTVASPKQQAARFGEEMLVNVGEVFKVFVAENVQEFIKIDLVLDPGSLSRDRTINSDPAKYATREAIQELLIVDWLWCAEFAFHVCPPFFGSELVVPVEDSSDLVEKGGAMGFGHRFPQGLAATSKRI